MGGSQNFADRQAKAAAQQREQQLASREAREKGLLGKARAGREEDLAAGRKRGSEIFGQGSLVTRDLETRRADFEDILARRRQALEGLSPEEKNALESQVVGGIQQATQGQLRQLRGIQGASGLRGATAAAQQARALQGGVAQQAQAQQNIFAQDIGARRQALSGLESTLGAEQQRAQQEKFGQLGTEFGFAQLGAAERGGIRQQLLGEQQAESARQQAAANQGKK